MILVEPKCRDGTLVIACNLGRYDRDRNSTEPKRPEDCLVTDKEREIYMERLKTLEQDRKLAIPADEAFRRILQKSKP